MRDSIARRGYYKPGSSRVSVKVRKTLFAKRQPRRTVRTPFRERTKEHGTERITGAELEKRTRCFRCQQLGHMSRECQNQASKDKPQYPAKGFSCQVTPRHSCTTFFLTWCVESRLKLVVGHPAISKPRPIGTHPMTSQNHKLPMANRVSTILSV